MTETEQNTSNTSENICPNCLEAIDPNAEKCPFCGEKLIDTAEDDSPSEETVTIAGQTVRKDNLITDETTKKNTQTRKEKLGGISKGFGLYIMIYAIMEMPAALKIENTQEKLLTIGGNLLYFAAGIYLAWPLVKELFYKITGGKKPSEEMVIPEEDTTQSMEDIKSVFSTEPINTDKSEIEKTNTEEPSTDSSYQSAVVEIEYPEIKSVFDEQEHSGSNN